MSNRRETGAKGAAAEASKAAMARRDAGLRENMSQTVTKVESYHWSKAGNDPAGRGKPRDVSVLTVSFSFFERFAVFSFQQQIDQKKTAAFEKEKRVKNAQPAGRPQKLDRLPHSKKFPNKRV